VAGDFEVATIVADAADKGEAGAVDFAVEADFEFVELGAELAETAEPIAEFAELSFDCGGDLAHDFGVEAGSGHEEEMAAVPGGEGDASGGGADGD